jgi:hypothetical protein
MSYLKVQQNMTVKLGILLGCFATKNIKSKLNMGILDRIAFHLLSKSLKIKIYKTRNL